MKRLIIAIVVVLILGVIAVYLFIPGELEVSVVSPVRCNSGSAFRGMKDSASWAKWWGDPGYGYTIEGSGYPEVAVRLGDAFESRLSVAPVDRKDSSLLLWKGVVVTGGNPIERVVRWREAVHLHAAMDAEIKRLRAFLEVSEHIYGFNLHEFMSQDSVVVMVEYRLGHYPSTAEVYATIRSIRGFIGASGLAETNHPMLNVARKDSGFYNVMIAVPVNGRGKDKGSFAFKRFVPWKMVGGEVSGGAATGEKAMQRLMDFVSDRQYTLMAIPFQQLITERDLEKDSSRWRTRVAVPVP